VTTKGLTLKVGAFVLFGIVLSTIAVFAIGDNRRVWDRKVTFYAAYDDVVGLRPGSVVRMGGIDVGSVTTVEHAKSSDDGKVYVSFGIVREEAGRIRNATVASIEGKGLLGDKMVVFAYDEHLAEEQKKHGKNPREVLPPGGTLATAPPGDPVGDAQKAAQQAKVAMENLQRATEGIADEKFKQDLHATVDSLRVIVDGVSKGDGAAHRLIFDAEEAKRVDRILGNLETTSANLAKVSEGADEIVKQVKAGPGLAHAVLYDDQLSQGLAGSLVELHQTLAAVRTGNGLAHSIVYGDDKTQQLMGNVNAMSTDLREIVANVRAGRGTVGALLVDPTVYEDIKALVGNVERNQVLRALVRYSIKQNEERPHAEVKAGAAPPPAPPP
jgi:phospholipid/cholesterol/gamma-HCH transport system substrate-binding protein